MQSFCNWANARSSRAKAVPRLNTCVGRETGPVPAVGVPIGPGNLALHQPPMACLYLQWAASNGIPALRCGQSAGELSSQCGRGLAPNRPLGASAFALGALKADCRRWAQGPPESIEMPNPSAGDSRH